MAINFNFAAVAAKALTSSPVMAGRTKIDPDELRDGNVYTMDEIGWYDAPDTDDHGNIITDENGAVVESTRVIAHFVEFPENYVNMGSQMLKVAQAFSAEFDGDIEAASDALKSEGGIKMKITLGRSAAGRKFNNYQIII